MKHRKHTRQYLLVSIAASALGACGEDGDEGAKPDSSSNPMGSATAPAQGTPPPGMTAVPQTPPLGTVIPPVVGLQAPPDYVEPPTAGLPASPDYDAGVPPGKPAAPEYAAGSAGSELPESSDSDQ